MDRGRPAHSRRRGRRPFSWTVGAPPTADGGSAVPPRGPWAPRPLRTARAPSLLTDRGRPAHRRRRGRRLSSRTVGAPPTPTGGGAVPPHGPWAPRPLRTAGAPSLLMDCGRPAHCGRQGRRPSSWTVGAPPTADGGAAVSPHGLWAPRPLRTAGAPSLLTDRGRPAHRRRRGRRLSSRTVGAPPTPTGGSAVSPHGPWAPRDPAFAFAKQNIASRSRTT